MGPTKASDGGSRWKVPPAVDRLLSAEPDNFCFQSKRHGNRRVWLKRAVNGVWTVWVEVLPGELWATDEMLDADLLPLAAHNGVSWHGPGPWDGAPIVLGFHCGHFSDLIPADPETHGRPYRDWSFAIDKALALMESMEHYNACWVASKFNM